MGDELDVPAGVLDEIRSSLGTGASGLESCGSSAPGSIDAGDATAVLSGMLSRLVDNAGALSESLTAISSQVGSVGAEFWRVDSGEAARYAGKPVADGP